MHDRGSNLWRNDITQNSFIWGALLICTGLLLTAVYFAPLATLLQVTAPTFREWLLIIGMSLIPLGVGQVFKVGRSQVSSF
jgi:Ca2+-transporting ATPase